MLNEDTKEAIEKLEIFIPAGPRLGDKVIEAKDVSKAFGDKILFENLNFSLPPAGIVGVIGPNGAGKTTLFRMIMGQMSPDSGTFVVGDTVKVAYVDQAHEEIDPNKSVFEVITEAMKTWNSTVNYSIHVHMWDGLTSAVPTKKKNVAYFRVENAIGYT
jgi:ATPase subunit of ABC transporter with duplicated ATPase domains